jgi:phospholipid/cholesterol/gamma-HCH transport system substrate-binding protein
MIIKTGVKLQLIAFAMITVLGVGYTLVHYLGVGSGLFNTRYTAYVEMADSGGAFTNSEVTYRGVPVGRVGPIRLTKNGVRIELQLKRGRHISRDTVAVVANRSAVGEQYIDLQPRTDKGPYLDSGPAYTIKNTRIPVQTAELLSNLDKLVTSVNPKDLGTIVDELNKAFAGSAADLQTILDSSDKLLNEANDHYDSTSQLLDNSKTVLATQRDKGTEIKTFARNLAVLTDEIRKDDPNIRSAITATGPAVIQVSKLIDDLGPTLPVLLSNLTATGQVVAQRIDGLRSLLILYPATLAGAFTVTPGDGTEHFGLVLNSDAPPPCTKGYEKARIRYPQATSDPPANLNLGCTLPKSSDLNVRGSRNAPQPKPGPSLPAGALDAAGAPPGGAYGTSGQPQTGGQSTSAGQSGSADQSKESDSQILPYQRALPDQSASSDPVYMTSYDPATGAYVGPDGKRYVVGTTGGQQRLLGDASWKWLLLGPLSK